MNNQTFQFESSKVITLGEDQRR